VYNAEVAQSTGQNSFGDIVILGVIAALAAVTMINTLAVATAERRSQVRLLARIGATGGQLAALFTGQALFVTLAGIAAGAAVCAGTLAGLDRAVTGRAMPYIPAGPATLIVATVAALTFGTILASLAVISRRSRAAAA
jgi:putative ABC transport system permease protein